MRTAQFRDGNGRWLDIPSVGVVENPDNLAWHYCKQHGIRTRIVEVNGKEVKVLKEIKIQKR
jgi:hypothetical protein